MRGSSLAEPAAWWELALEWPVEYVPCQVEVVEPRLLTALEWAVLRVLEEFGDEPPSLEEASEELGLGEPRFLADILRSLLRLGALAPLPEVAEPTRFNEVRFTERGRELFLKGQVDGEPNTQGHELCFDGLTDEALPAPGSVTQRPQRPVVEESTLSEPRQDIGLERVREVVRQMGIKLGGADAWVRSARVLPPEESFGLRRGHLWAVHKVALVAAAEGRLLLRTPSLTDSQRRRLLELPLERWARPAQAITASWAARRASSRGGQPWVAWRKSVERLVPVARVLEEAQRLINSARREVQVHAAWLAAPGIAQALAAAAKGGKAVYIAGAESTRIVQWVAEPGRAPGFVVEVACKELLPTALVVDGSEALVLDEVLAEVEELGRHACEVVGWTQARAAALGESLRKAVLGHLPVLEAGQPLPLDLRRNASRETGVKELLEDPRLRLALARLLLSPDSGTWDSIAGWVASRCSGTNRVEAVRQIADLASGLTPDSSSGPWRQAWEAAWRSLQAALVEARAEHVAEQVLIDYFELAPPQVAREQVLDPLVARWVSPAPLTRNARPAVGSMEFLRMLRSVSRPVSPGAAALQALTQLRALFEQRYQGRAAEECPGFREALELCLKVVHPMPEGPELAEAAEQVSRVALKERARQWAGEVAGLWPAPDSFHGYEIWRRRHEPLSALLGEELKARLASQWKALARALPVSSEALLADQLRHAQGIVEAADALETLLVGPWAEKLAARVERLLRVKAAFRAAWRQQAPAEDFWDQRLRQLLAGEQVERGGLLEQELQVAWQRMGLRPEALEALLRKDKKQSKGKDRRSKP